MRNTYIAPGKEDPEAVIGSVKNGLLVKKMGGGQVNTVNGDFVFDVAEGYLIKDGKVAHAVRGATLAGNGPEVLRRIDMIGSDLGFSIGTCGKDGQGAPVADAQPTIRIPEIVVGGTTTPAAHKRNLARVLARALVEHPRPEARESTHLLRFTAGAAFNKVALFFANIVD
jgi:TldD protein